MMKMKRLPIEDTSDCATCQQRDRERFLLMQAVRIKCLGTAWCQDCGRAYEAICEEDDAQEKSGGGSGRETGLV